MKAYCIEMNRAITVHKLRPVIEEIFGFYEVKKAYRSFAEGRHFGKVVISGV